MKAKVKAVRFAAIQDGVLARSKIDLTIRVVKTRVVVESDLIATHPQS